MSSPSSAQAAFSKAIREFKTGLKDPALYSEILNTMSIDQVYDLTDKLQKVQGRGDHLRNLARIQPFLERLRGYAGAIDTFVQVKPDILGLIWGPIKLLLQWTSNLTKSLDALVTATAEIGNLLSEFDHAAKLFSDKRHINEVLALLFQDILDFYLVSLKFFRMERWKSFFEALWPKKKEEIEQVIARMNDHTSHLRNEVRLEDIEEAYDARQLQIREFEKLDKATRKQEFQAVETAIAPTFYSKKLNHLLSRVCKGSEDWLVNDPEMDAWMRVNNTSQKVIWLCGIPGAGKSYLAAFVIKASMSVGYTVFAILSHEQRETSVLSVIHSLIFQLAKKDPNLQDIVRNTDRDSLEFDIQSTVELLTNRIRAAGAVRIVIDGLDEIEDLERTRLLRQLLKISSNCDEARLLISSRSEADIKTLLEKSSKAIRVDSQNTASINEFVMSRYHEWRQEVDRSPEDAAEIEKLMSNVPEKAKGMFLYAHLTLKSLDYWHSVSEIKRDLRVLPRDLNAAYDRIFTRMNQGLPDEATREKARKALGWIAFSPVPLAIRELEQALVIQIGDLDQDPTGITTLHLVRLCGPVDEEVGGELHLVHFTAKEYFFSAEIQNSLDPAQCVLSLAKCCITYLCQHHHDNNLDKRLFQEKVIRGTYRLQHFASDNWSRLVKSYLELVRAAEDPAGSTDLTQLIATLDLLTSRASDQYLQSEVRADYMSLGLLETESSKDAHAMVWNDLEFHREASTRLFELDKGKWQWHRADPLLILRRTTASLHDAIEALVCPPSSHRNPCYCRDIRRHYGHPFKCSFVGCDYQRLGFDTSKDRNEHCKTHDRPWTCDDVDCEYHHVGFVSRQMRNRHLDEAHRVDQPREDIKSTLGGEKEQVALLKALIRKNKLLKGSAAMQIFNGLRKNLRSDVVEEAARSGTYELMKLLRVFPSKEDSRGELAIDAVEKWIPAALKGRNLETLRWFQAVTREPWFLQGINEGISSNLFTEHSSIRIWRALMESDDPEGMALLVEPVQLAVARAFADESMPKSRSLCFDREWIRVSDGDHVKEAMLISFWEKLRDTVEVNKVCWGIALCSVAATTCLITLATWLCKNGARLDYVKSHKLGPPLLTAARNNTLESAELMRFFLYQGADPECKHRNPCGKALVSALKGPRGLQKWLNISWDELVEEAKEARKNNHREHEP